MRLYFRTAIRKFQKFENTNVANVLISISKALGIIHLVRVQNFPKN